MAEEEINKDTKKNKKKKKKNKKKMKFSLNKLFWILAIIIFFIIAYIGKDFDWNEALNTNLDFNNIDIEIDIFNNLSNNTSNQVNDIKVGSEDLKVYFIDVGQADSILVIDGDKTMLIDAGTNEKGESVVNFIKSKGVSKIDFLVGTHPHEDHIGGMDDVINAFEIGRIYMPKVQTNTKTFEDVLNAIESKKLSVTTPIIGDEFVLENAKCEIMSTANNAEELNLSSIVIRMVYGDQSFLFMGDAVRNNEESRDWPQTTILKVGHHGSDTSTSKEFLEKVQPKIAIISCGKDNSYGHPAQITLDKLSNIGAQIYRTDEMGTILITSNGRTNKVETNIK